jgi:hypothetical protein
MITSGYRISDRGINAEMTGDFIISAPVFANLQVQCNRNEVAPSPLTCISAVSSDKQFDLLGRNSP